MNMVSCVGILVQRQGELWPANVYHMCVAI
jgi:hypothetical protein